MPKNVGDLGKLIVAKGFKKLPKVQKIAKSGHTGLYLPAYFVLYFRLFDSLGTVHCKTLPLTGFKLLTSVMGSHHSAN